jgi:hypothetical protein
MIFFKTILHCFTIWIVASLINGFLCGIYLGIVSREFSGTDAMLPAFFFSFLFSAPGVFLFWLFYYPFAASGRIGRPLFFFLLQVAFGCSLFIAIMGGAFLFHLFHWHVLVIGCAVLVSALSSLFIHRSAILSLHQ